MKKLLLFLLVTYQSTLLSQTVLASYPLDLKRYDQNNTIVNVENKATHDVFVFATNTQNLTILKYNNALFLKDEFTISRANLENKSILGYSFSEDGNPTLYWASEDSSEILVVKYYLETKTYKILKFQYPSSSEYIVAKFQSNNLLYLLSKELTSHTLTAYVFKNGIAKSSLTSQATIGKKLLNIKVTDLEGGRVSFGMSLVRNFSKILSVIPVFFGYLYSFLNKKNQCWHDIAASTLVIKDRLI